MMNRHAEAIVDRLDRERRFLLRRRLAVAVLVAIGAGLAPVLLGAAADLVWTIPEPGALALVLASVGLGFLALGAGLAWLGRHDPGRTGVAGEIEDGCPEFMDALACAVELADEPPERLNPLNLALLEQVAADLHHRQVHAVVARRTVGGALLAGLALLAAALLAGAWFTTPVQRARANALDRLHHRNTGLTVEPGNIEIARGDDLHIRATIYRGPQRARLEVVRHDGSRADYTLYPEENGHGFELFGVHQSFAYRVVTPTLRSRSYAVKVFARPEVIGSGIRIEPPVYTGRPRRQLEELADVTAAQNSRVILRVATSLPCTVRWQPTVADARVFATADGREHSLELRVLDDVDWRLVLDDRQGHLLPEPRLYHLECLRDFPPVISIDNPPEDAATDKTGAVPFAIQVIDDYGVRTVELAYSINGRAWQRTDVYRFAGDGAVKKEEKLSHSFPLDGRVDYGDVISYYVVADDNAEPEPNSARTQMRFLEVRPKRLDQLEDAKGQPGEKQTTLEVADLIRRQKDLIRQTWDTVLSKTSPDELKDLADALAKVAGDLLMDTRRRFNDLKDMAQGLSLGPIGGLFDEAIGRMETAELLLRQELPNDSLTFQQEALSKLVSIEIELLRNAKRMQGQGGQGKQQQPQQRVSEEDRDQERQQRLDQLREQMAQVESLQRRQDALNARLANQPRESTDAARERLAAEQERLREDARGIREALARVPEAAGAIGELEKAANAMRGAANAQRGNQPANATKHGQMASQFLDRTRELLEEAQQGLSGSKLQSAQKQLDQLRQDQQGLRQQTSDCAGNAPGCRAAPDIAKDQADLRERTDDLLRQLDEAARELGNDQPEAGRQLGQALRQARQQNLTGDMKRAENALRYRRSKRALDYQDQAIDQLDQLGKAMAEAMAAGSRPNAEELADMLRQTLEKLAANQQQQRQGATEEEAEALRQAIQQQLEEMARHLQDPTMQQLAQQVRGLGGARTIDAAGQLTTVLSRAAEVLESKLFESSLQRQLQLARLAGRLPPDEYRKLVDKYFKSLGEATEE